MDAMYIFYTYGAYQILKVSFRSAGIRTIHVLNHLDLVYRQALRNPCFRIQ